jgi:quinol monooxygenase YgiN
MEICIFGRFHAKPGCEDAVMETMLAGLAPTRAEPGCVSSNVFRGTRDPQTFFIHSRWKDEAAFEIHAEMPHTVHFLERMETLIDHPFDIKRTQRIG